MQPEPSSNKKLIGIIGLAVIVAAIGAGVFAFSHKPAGSSVTGSPSPTVASAAITPSPTASSGTEATAAATSKYKDGTFTGSADYDTPGGSETVDVSLTLKGGVVTDSTVKTSEHNHTGAQYQRMFVSSYKSLVTGKDIDSINLSRVSGSSLTSRGFNGAVAKIKTQAHA
jgi:uncharacterized protein with FMN-binding domain